MTYENSIIPGFNNKAHKEIEKEIRDLKARHDSIANAIQGNKRFYEKNEAPKGTKGVAYETMVKQLDKLDEIDAQIKDLNDILASGSFAIDPGYNEDPYTPSEIGFSFGNTNGRAYIGSKLERVPLDHYEETYTASEYIQGTIPETNFEDLLSVLKTDEDSSIMFDSDIAFGPGLRDDDRENVEKAISHAHDVGMINAENKKACEILRSVKDPVSMDAEYLQDVINANLCAKAKKKAVILVNHSGFAKIDTVDAGGGYPLVKRDPITRDNSGEFIYRDKYLIIELADEILPNNTDGSSPVIIGDLSIVKFFVMRDDALEKDEFAEFKIHDRRLKREVIALSSTSDRAYIHGSIK